MNLNEKFPISSHKVEELLNRLKTLKIDPNKIEEQFTRGSGPGGQKINKSSNTVILKYPPLNLLVKAGSNRQRSINRFLALRELLDQAEIKISPSTSKRLKEWAKVRRQKKRRARRAEVKKI